MARQPARKSKAKPTPGLNDPKPIKVNRELFMAWTEGTIMDRDAKGNVLVTDHLDKRFQEAEDAMEAGGIIYLTDNSGKVITQMQDDGKGYSESVYNG